MDGLLHAIIHLGWVAVLAVIFAESGLMVGFFFPGDSLLFTAGFLVHQGVIEINIHLFVPLLFLAAVAGNSTGYLFGAKVGRRLFERENSRFFKKKYLVAAENFYEKNGPKTIILAMFVPIVRTFTPIVAGISHMPYRKFLTFNVIGAALWTAGLTYLGFFAGAAIRHFGLNIETTILLIVFLSLLPGIFHVLKEPSNRAHIKRHVKRVHKKVFKRSSK